MEAVTYDRYGSFENLAVRDIAQPAIKDDEVLIRVRAASLQIGDVFAVHGAPYMMRMMTGLFRPKLGAPGFDIAGTVEAVGKRVTQFRAGDDVFGGCRGGACAQYARTRPDQLALKPTMLTFEEAAATTTSAVAALTALRKVANVQPGQRVLINGASGGIGTFAVQIAKAFGAHVTGVCSTKNVELVRSLGADEVIDYTQQDFTQHQYDVILDNVENRALADVRRALAPRGTLVLNSGTGAQGFAMFARLVKPIIINPFVRQRLRRFVSAPNHDDLVSLIQLVESGALKPVIDRTYRLAEVPAALAHIEGGHARGKVIVTI